MASITNDPNGRKRIEFLDGHKRKTIRLGKVPAKAAEAFRLKVEAIVSDRITGQPHGGELSRWLRDLDPKIRDRLARVGLVEGVSRLNAGAVTLRRLLTEAEAAASVKASTKLVHGHARRNLIDYFGDGKLLREIGPLEADQWRQWLKSHEHLGGPTISKRVKLARQFFAKAIEWEMIERNPFAKVKAGKQTNDARQFFVERPDVAKVIEACPDAQWRLIVALSRYGGLRCPSEHLGLTWADVDWDRGRITVRSPKTEHHEGGDFRLLPIFPELRGPLLDVFEQAEPGAAFVITRYRQRNSNLRTQLERIMARAGVKPWPKLFHNLRASRQTELEQDHPSHVVCAWLGNSPDVARKHYLQVRDSDFDKATGKATEQAAATPRNAPQAVRGNCQNPRVLPVDSGSCEQLQILAVAPVGLEPTRFLGDGF